MKNTFSRKVFFMPLTQKKSLGERSIFKRNFVHIFFWDGTNSMVIKENRNSLVS